MSFRLVPKSVTLNDLERRNSPNGTVISPNSVAFGADYLKVVEDTPILSAAERYPKACIVFSGIFHRCMAHLPTATFLHVSLVVLLIVVSFDNHSVIETDNKPIHDQGVTHQLSVQMFTVIFMSFIG